MQLRFLWRLVVGICLLLGQSGCRSAPSTQARELAPDELPQDGSLSLSLRAILVEQTAEGTKERAVGESETLRSGDHVYFVLRVSRPAFLSAVLFGSDGQASALFPTATRREQRILGGCPLRIPEQGTFYLRQPAGLEDLRAVASLEPLGQADPRLCEELRLPCPQPPLVEPQPAQCPKERGRPFFALVKMVTASERGVASLRWGLRHDP